MTLRLLLPCAMCLVLVACSTSTDPKPSDPKGTSVVVEKVTSLPYTGGDVASVDVMLDGSVLAVINNKLCVVPASGGAAIVYPAIGNILAAAVGGNGEVYVMTDETLYVLPTLNSTPINTTFVFSSNWIESVTLDVSPSGQAFVRMVQYPSSIVASTTTDHGVTWTTVNLPSNGGIAWGAANTMYCSGTTAFCYSTDNGETWEKYPAVLPNYGGQPVVRSNGDVLYYVPNGGGLWSSSNHGNSFTNLSPFNKAPFHKKIVEGGDGFLYSIATQESTIGADVRLMKSKDGITWEHVLFAQGGCLAMRGSTIAVGFSGMVKGGGVAVSQNGGSTFAPGGMRTVSEIGAIGLRNGQDLMMLADKGLFARGTTGWTTMGCLESFSGFASTPTGSMVVAGTKYSYSSSDNGTTWKSVSMPDIPVVGSGWLATPVVIGLSNGDCLVSVTHYRDDLGKHTNGVLSRITSSGTLSELQRSTNYVWMVQDAQGTIYARTDNFVTNQESRNNGASFTEVTKVAPGFVFTSDNRAINHNGSNGFTISNVDRSSTSPLTLTGFTGLSWMVTQGVVDKQNKLYLLSSDQGVFVSTTGL
ncbi:MAG: exo-alpha-sialidase [Bradyrhizobiaceae bacterium]|nr:exo-alpha-sialidase [Bradyrhizobiaceae bacterium]